MRERFDFSAWPVVQRELREGARRWANYRLRVGSGLAGGILLWLTVSRAQGDMGQTGLQLFLRLHCLMLLLIVGIVPGMAADCIARERREGTLGLLFLTPLTARGVVLGKSLAQILRALTLWLAMLPVLTIPFLTGGVTRSEAFHMLNIEFCAAVICMAAGIAASALAKSRNGAYFLAYALAVVALASVATFAAIIITPVGPRGQIPTWDDLLTDGVMMATGNGANSRQAIIYYTMVSRFPGYRIPRALPTVTPGNKGAWSVYSMIAILAAAELLWLAIVLGAAAIRRLWKDEIGSGGKKGWARRFCVPLFLQRYHRQTQRSLDHNPIVWLQQYSWKARASKWGLCGAFILLESYALRRYADSYNGFWNGFPQMQALLALFLAAVFTFVGVSSFLTEKRSGALELLLVTPISVTRLILGRAWGLWKQFLPAALILLMGEIGATSLEGTISQHWALGRGRGIFISEDTFLPIFVCANAFLALPIFATYCALRVKNLIGAAALTWAGIAVAWMMALCVADSLAWKFMGGDLESPMICGATMVCNAAFIALTFFLLRHSLSRRIYSF